MLDKQSQENGFTIPGGFILFVSGVPGVGKTTISYEVLKKFNEFRIIEETDILRDALIGYNKSLLDLNNALSESQMNIPIIFEHTKLFSLTEAKQQCTLMKKSIEHIVARQQRKEISSIINGVHIVPEILKEFFSNPKILFINLFISDETTLFKRLKGRDPSSYMMDYVSFIYQSNLELYQSTKNCSNLPNSPVYNIDITYLSITQTISRITECIKIRCSLDI
jgi:2-phosphoglycerate kinase